MTEQSSIAPTRKTRRIFAGIGLLFSFFIISYVIYAGDPSNSLHQSSLSWAFSMAMFVMGAYAFSASFDTLVERKWK
jgi:hypothetical protein